MQLQCLEVPRSVEVCLKSTRQPKTQIHFPNPDTVPRIELTSQGGISACQLSDLRGLTVSDHLPRNSKARNDKRQEFSGEDVLHRRPGDLVNLFRRPTRQRLRANELRPNHSSTPPEDKLQEGQREQSLSSPSSSNGLVYQTSPSSCESSTRLSEESAKPSCSSGATGRRARRNRPQSRKNCWGGTSYTDLITAAIESSPHRRMSLAQIYEWIVKNVPYFKDKERYLSVQGWKNTVRHTLSIRRRFIRIKDPKRPYRSMWTVGDEEGSRRVTPTATKRLKPRPEAMETSH